MHWSVRVALDWPQDADWRAGERLWGHIGPFKTNSPVWDLAWPHQVVMWSEDGPILEWDSPRIPTSQIHLSWWLVWANQVHLCEGLDRPDHARLIFPVVARAEPKVLRSIIVQSNLESTRNAKKSDGFFEARVRRIWEHSDLEKVSPNNTHFIPF